MFGTKVSTAILALLCCLVAGLALAAENPAPAVERADVSTPVLIPSSRVAPEFPPAALAARFEGTVTLAAKVLTDGSVGEVEILESSRPNLGFERAAERAVQQWQFEPARQGSETIQAYSVVRLHFKVPGTRTRPSAYVVNEFIPGTFIGEAPSNAFPSGEITPAATDDPKLRLIVPSMPCQAEGCMYDRREMFRIPQDGLQTPNNHRKVGG